MAQNFKCIDLCLLLHNILKIEDIELAVEVTNRSVQRSFSLRDAATVWLNCLQNPSYARYLLVSILQELEKGTLQASTLPSEFVMRRLWTLPQILLYLYSQFHIVTAQQNAPNFLHCLPEFSSHENISDRCLLMIKQYFKRNMAQLGGSEWLTLEQLTHPSLTGKEALHSQQSVMFSNQVNIVLVDSIGSHDAKPTDPRSPLISAAMESRLAKHNTLQSLFDEASIELDLLKCFRPSLSDPGTVVIISCAGTAIFSPKKGDSSLVIGTSKSANISLRTVCPTAALQHLILTFDADKCSSLISNIGYEQSVFYMIYKPGFKSTAVDLRPGGKLFFNLTHNYESRPVMVAVYIYGFPLLMYVF